MENILYKMTLQRFLTSLLLQSTLSEMDTVRTSTKCPAYRYVRLIESQIKGVKNGRGPTLSGRYREVSVSMEVSVKRESTV